MGCKTVKEFPFSLKHVEVDNRFYKEKNYRKLTQTFLNVFLMYIVIIH